MKTGRVNNVSVPLQVVLGTTEATLEQLSSLGQGTIIELDKLAGEPVDLIAAGIVVAKGEVVVIDENFGIRVTEMVSDQG